MGHFEFGQFDWPPEAGCEIRGKDDFVAADHVSERGQWHLLPLAKRCEKRFKLSLIRMVGDIAGIEQFETHFTPSMLVKSWQVHVEPLIQDAALAANKMRVEVIRLETIDDGGAFPDASVGEFRMLTLLVSYSYGANVWLRDFVE